MAQLFDAFAARFTARYSAGELALLVDFMTRSAADFHASARRKPGRPKG